jgi:DNA-binding phage protein
MNRSYSKIRHIQLSNLILEERLIDDPKTISKQSVNYESGAGLEKITLIDNNIKSLGINIKKELINIKTIEGNYDDIKEEINIYLDKVLGTMTAESIMDLIKKIKEVNNRQKYDSDRSESVELNEAFEDPALRDLNNILSILKKFGLKIPFWAWTAILVWVILRLLKCYIYKLESKLFTNDAAWKQSKIAKFTFILLLDFKNDNKSSNTLYGCDRTFKK